MIIDPKDEKLSIVEQCELLKIYRSGLYHKPCAISVDTLEIMKRMDKMYLEDSTRGTRCYSDDLALEGILIGRDRVRTLMRIMGITALCCRPRTTVTDPAKYKYPYLLRGLKVFRSNQV